MSGGRGLFWSLLPTKVTRRLCFQGNWVKVGNTWEMLRTVPGTRYACNKGDCFCFLCCYCWIQCSGLLSPCNIPFRSLGSLSVTFNWHHGIVPQEERQSSKCLPHRHLPVFVSLASPRPKYLTKPLERSKIYISLCCQRAQPVFAWLQCFWPEHPGNWSMVG